MLKEKLMQSRGLLSPPSKDLGEEREMLVSQLEGAQAEVGANAGNSTLCVCVCVCVCVRVCQHKDIIIIIVVYLKVCINNYVFLIHAHVSLFDCDSHMTKQIMILYLIN